MDVKKVLALIDSVEQKKTTLTEGKNMAKDMVMQHYTKKEIKSPIKKPVSRLNEYFKVVDNEMLNVIKEEREAKRVEVKSIVNRVLERLDEGKKAEAPKPRNFVAKNAKTAGAGAHKDKKKAEKQGDLKHKKEKVPMDEGEQLSEKAVSKAQQKFMGMVHAAKKGEKPASKEVAKAAKGMSGKAAKDFARPKHKGLPNKKVDEVAAAALGAMAAQAAAKKLKSNPAKPASPDNPWTSAEVDEVAGPEKCWPGHRKVGTKPGTGKNAGKRVNDCEKIGETIEVGSPVKVYSNVLKKPVLGTVVAINENKAYVNYNNTKIVMGHPISKVELNEAAAAAVPAAAGIGSKLARFIPGVGLVAGGYDAYKRAQAGDYTGAALSAGAGLAGLVPGLGTAVSTGLIGAQMGRDYAKTGSVIPGYDEIGKAAQKGQAPTPAPQPNKKTGVASPVTQMQAELQKAGATITVDGKMGPQTRAAMAQFPAIAKKYQGKLPAAAPAAKPAPAQAATPAPAAAPAAPSGATTTQTSSNTSVSGTMKMGKPDGPITFNGKTVNPGDPDYEAASQALIAQSGRIQQYKQNMRPGAAKSAPTGGVTQGASQELDRDF